MFVISFRGSDARTRIAQKLPNNRATEIHESRPIVFIGNLPDHAIAARRADDSHHFAKYSHGDRGNRNSRSLMERFRVWRFEYPWRGNQPRGALHALNRIIDGLDGGEYGIVHHVRP